MTITDDRLLTAVSSRLRNMLSRYAPLALTLFILGLGVFIVLLAQPSPLTFTAGWSAPQAIDAAKLAPPHRAVVDGRVHIHPVRQKPVSRKPVALDARLD